MPVEILKRYEKWKDIARVSGPLGLRAVKGFHDEALAGEWKGHRSSFKIGGEVLPGKMGKAQVQGLATQIRMGMRYLQPIALSLAAKVPSAIDEATKDIYPDPTKSWQTFAEKLAMHVKAITKQSAHRFE